MAAKRAAGKGDLVTISGPTSIVTADELPSCEFKQARDGRQPMEFDGDSEDDDSEDD